MILADGKQRVMDGDQYRTRIGRAGFGRPFELRLEKTQLRLIAVGV